MKGDCGRERIKITCLNNEWGDERERERKKKGERVKVCIGRKKRGRGVRGG